MKKSSVIIISMLSGAITGAFVLGLIGKFVMALISIFVGSNMNLSLSGILESLIIGTGVGAFGGLINVRISNSETLSMTGQGLVLGTILYALSVLMTIVLTKMKIDLTGQQFFTLVAVFGIYIVYGLSAAALLNRLKLQYPKKLV